MLLLSALVGIAEAGPNKTRKGFPAGGLLFESSFDVDQQHVAVRRPSKNDVITTANGTKLQASDLTVTCNELYIQNVRGDQVSEYRVPLVRGAVCLKPPEMPCPSSDCFCETVWCDEPPPPCPEDTP